MRWVWALVAFLAQVRLNSHRIPFQTLSYVFENVVYSRE